MKRLKIGKKKTSVWDLVFLIGVLSFWVFFLSFEVFAELPLWLEITLWVIIVILIIIIIALLVILSGGTALIGLGFAASAGTLTGWGWVALVASLLGLGGAGAALASCEEQDSSDDGDDMEENMAHSEEAVENMNNAHATSNPCDIDPISKIDGTFTVHVLERDYNYLGTMTVRVCEQQEFSAYFKGDSTHEVGKGVLQRGQDFSKTFTHASQDDFDEFCYSIGRDEYCFS